MGEVYEEFGAQLEDESGRFEGVSRGPGADLGRALQQAAKAAADAGRAGERFSVAIDIEPQEHNQWVRTYRVIISS